MKRDIDRDRMHAADNDTRRGDNMHAADNGARRSENKVGGGVFLHKTPNKRSSSSNARGRAVRGKDGNRSASVVCVGAGSGAVRIRKAASIALMFAMVFCLTLGLILSGEIFALPSADAATKYGQFVSFEQTSNSNFKVRDGGFNNNSTSSDWTYWPADQWGTTMTVWGHREAGDTKWPWTEKGIWEINYPAGYGGYMYDTKVWGV